VGKVQNIYLIGSLGGKGRGFSKAGVFIEIKQTLIRKYGDRKSRSSDDCAHRPEEEQVKK